MLEHRAQLVAHGGVVLASFLDERAARLRRREARGREIQLLDARKLFAG
jgi:hypothetical protein